MGWTIEINAPHLLPQLLERLEADGCLAEAIDPHSCRVIPRDSLEPNEALTELRFFTRAWAGAHDGVIVTLQPEA